MKIFRVTFASAKKLVEALVEGEWDESGAYIVMKGAIDSSEWNARNFDVYALASTIGYKNAAKWLIKKANATRVRDWFFYDNHHGIIWKIRFNTFGFETEKLAVWDYKKKEFVVKVGKNNNEPMCLRNFILSVKAPEKKAIYFKKK